MTMLYSPTTRGFYHPDIHGDAVPGDVVEISQEHYDELLSAQETGAQIVPGSNGFPEAIEQPVPELSYAQKRIRKYPSIGDQLDALFHAGVFPAEMAAQIQAVKDQYPKGQA